MNSNDPFDTCVNLSHEVIFFVPSTDNVNEINESLQENVIAYLSEQLAVAYGGVTRNAPARGGWRSELGMVWETTVPVTVYVEELTFEVKSHVMTLARYIRDTMHQEAVLFVVDGQGKLVTA